MLLVVLLDPHQNGVVVVVLDVLLVSPAELVVVLDVVLVSPAVVVVVALQVSLSSDQLLLAADQTHLHWPSHGAASPIPVVVVVLLVVEAAASKPSTTQTRSAFCRAVNSVWAGASSSVCALENSIWTGVPSTQRWGSYTPAVVSRNRQTATLVRIQLSPDLTACGISQQAMPCNVCGDSQI